MNDVATRPYDPVRQAVEGLNLAEYVGQALAGFSARQGEVQQTDYGPRAPVVVGRLVIFDKQGNVEVEREDWHCWQKRLQDYFLQGNGTVFARLIKDGQAYDLERLADKTYSRISQIALERGWLTSGQSQQVASQQDVEAF